MENERKGKQALRKPSHVFSLKRTLVLMLISLVLGGSIVFAAVTLSYTPITVRVQEPLSLSQSTVSFASFAGSVDSFALNVSNVANKPIPFILAWSSSNSSLISLAANGQPLPAAGVQFTAPADIVEGSVATAGVISISVSVTTSTSSPAGTITVQFTATR